MKKDIFVYLYNELIGCLHSSALRGKELFSFEYDKKYLQKSKTINIDPEISLFEGFQYSSQQNFGVFLDSCPDRWGRLLIRRKEEQIARQEKRPVKFLFESDYLLGVSDSVRLGAIQFKLDHTGEFLDNQSPAIPLTSHIKELEFASLSLESNTAEKNKSYLKWLNYLLAPGASLGGARPKASVIDSEKNLWIAKFPSRNDEFNIGAWEFLANQLAQNSGLNTCKTKIKKLNTKHDTFFIKRFDRLKENRIHFMSAMTALKRQDHNSHEASYLDIADFIIRFGSHPEEDLKELFARIAFNICISNIDDHLRNHGFLLNNKGWRLSPIYDINPCEYSNNLSLNISQNDNSQNLELLRETAEYYRLNAKSAELVIKKIKKAVAVWKDISTKLKIPKVEISRMKNAFRFAEE